MNKSVKLWLIFLIILAGGLVCLNLFVLGKKLPKTEISVTKPPTANPTLGILEPTVAEVLDKGGGIPFDYEVVAASADMITIEGLKGKMNLTNKPTTKVFWKRGENIEETDFSSLEVGQKLVLELGERTGTDREIKIYILQ